MHKKAARAAMDKVLANNFVYNLELDKLVERGAVDRLTKLEYRFGS